MDLYLRNLCVNDLTVLLFSLFNSKSIADASFVRKMADDHVNIDMKGTLKKIGRYNVNLFLIWKINHSSLTKIIFIELNELLSLNTAFLMQQESR